MEKTAISSTDNFNENMSADEILKRYKLTTERLRKSQKKLQNSQLNEDLYLSVFTGFFLGVSAASFAWVFKDDIVSQTSLDVGDLEIAFPVGVTVASVPIVACVLRRKMLKHKIKKLEEQQSNFQKELNKQTTKPQNIKDDFSL